MLTRLTSNNHEQSRLINSSNELGYSKRELCSRIAIVVFAAILFSAASLGIAAACVGTGGVILIPAGLIGLLIGSVLPVCLIWINDRIRFVKDHNQSSGTIQEDDISCTGIIHQDDCEDGTEFLDDPLIWQNLFEDLQFDLSRYDKNDQKWRAVGQALKREVEGVLNNFRLNKFEGLIEQLNSFYLLIKNLQTAASKYATKHPADVLTSKKISSIRQFLGTLQTNLDELMPQINALQHGGLEKALDEVSIQLESFGDDNRVVLDTEQVLGRMKRLAYGKAVLPESEHVKIISRICTEEQERVSISKMSLNDQVLLMKFADEFELTKIKILCEREILFTLLKMNLTTLLEEKARVLAMLKLPWSIEKTGIEKLYLRAEGDIY